MAAEGNEDKLYGAAQRLLVWLREQAGTDPRCGEITDSLRSDEPDIPALAKKLDALIESAGASVAWIGLSTSLDDIGLSDIVVIATNSVDPELVRPEMVKEGAIVCCASLPSNISSRFDSLQDTYRSFDGGLAKLPEDSTIDFVGMPGDQMAFGCLSETLLLGFDGQNHSFCKGELTTDQVYRTIELAKQYHFDLGELTLHNTKVTST